MKKSIGLSVLFLLTIPFMNSCGATQGLGSLKTIGKVANIAQTAGQISDVLGGTLGLSNTKKSSVKDIFSDYIGGTNDIADLADSDKKKYKDKLSSLNKDTKGKLDNIMGAREYAKLLRLGGKNDKKGSLVDSLDGGGSLSDNAKEVLTGLLLNHL